MAQGLTLSPVVGVQMDLDDTIIPANETRTTLAVKDANPLFASVLGSPFGEDDLDVFSDSSFDDESSTISNESHDESPDDKSDEETMSMYSDDDDDSATMTAFESFLEVANRSSGQKEQEECLSEEQALVDQEQVQVDQELIPVGEEQARLEILKSKLSQAFEELAKCSEEMSEYTKMVQEERVLVETSKVLELINGSCQVEGCTGERKVLQHTLQGGVMSVTYRCSNGHGGVWHSSSVLTEKRPEGVCYISAAVFISPAHRK